MLLTVSYYHSSSYSQLYSQHLEECLAHSGCPRGICWMSTDCCVTWNRRITLSGLPISHWQKEALAQRKVPNLSAEDPQRLSKLPLKPLMGWYPKMKYHWTQKISFLKNKRWPWQPPPIIPDSLRLETGSAPSTTTSWGHLVTFPNILLICIKTDNIEIMTTAANAWWISISQALFCVHKHGLHLRITPKSVIVPI